METAIARGLGLWRPLLRHDLGGNDLKREGDSRYQGKQGVDGCGVSEAVRAKKPRNGDVVDEIGCSSEARTREQYDAPREDARA